MKNQTQKLKTYFPGMCYAYGMPNTQKSEVENGKMRMQ